MDTRTDPTGLGCDGSLLDACAILMIFLRCMDSDKIEDKMSIVQTCIFIAKCERPMLPSSGMTPQMKIAVTCGGTGGHVFPGIATANELARQGHDVAVVLSGRDVESVSGWTGQTLHVPCPRPRWRNPIAAVRTLWGLARAFLAARRTFAIFKPSVLLAMGSYTSFGPVLAARSLGIPVVLHDANAVPGAAVSLLCRAAKVVAVSFDEAATHLPRRVKTVKTGLPIRVEALLGLPFGAPRSSPPTQVMKNEEWRMKNLGPPRPRDSVPSGPPPQEGNGG